MRRRDERDGAGRRAGPVPPGWQRRVRDGAVTYVSPSGAALASPEQLRSYLLAEGTCKCGLECPLHVHKVFDFDPGAAAPASPGPRGQQDMTKLCNHRRKAAPAAPRCRPRPGPALGPLFPAGGHLVSRAGAAPPGDPLVPRPREAPPRATGSAESRPPAVPPPTEPPRAPGRTGTRGGVTGTTGAPERWGAGAAPPAGQDEAPPRDALSDQSSNKSPEPLAPRGPPAEPAPPPSTLPLPAPRGTLAALLRLLGAPPAPAGVPAPRQDPGPLLGGLLAPPPAEPDSGTPPAHGAPGQQRPPGAAASPGAPPGDPPAPREEPPAPGLLLGPLPPPGGDPAGPPPLLPLLPLGVPLPALELLPPRGGPEGPLLFSTPPPPLLGAPGGSPDTPPSGLASPPPAPTSTGAPPTTTEAPRGEGPPGRPRPLGPTLGSSVLGATLLGDVPALGPLVQSPALLPPLPPLGLPPGPAALLGGSGPLGCLLQGLQLGPAFGPPEKPLDAGGPPSPTEGPPSALEPPGAGGGTRGGPSVRAALKRGRRRPEGLPGEGAAPRGPPGTRSPRRGAARARGGRAPRCRLNRQAGAGAPPSAPPAAWRCNGAGPAERQPRPDDTKGGSLRLRPARRGRRRKASAPRPSARLEPPRGRGVSAKPGPPAVEPSRRPGKSRRRKPPT